MTGVLFDHIHSFLDQSSLKTSSSVRVNNFVLFLVLTGLYFFMKIVCGCYLVPHEKNNIYWELNSFIEPVVVNLLGFIYVQRDLTDTSELSVLMLPLLVSLRGQWKVLTWAMWESSKMTLSTRNTICLWRLRCWLVSWYRFSVWSVTVRDYTVLAVQNKERFDFMHVTFKYDLNRYI